VPTSTITPLPRYVPEVAPTATLTMRAGAFTPKVLAVAPGTVIRVVNADSEMHSLMPAEFEDHQMRSSDVGPGNSVHMTAPDTPGEYKYTCLYHSWVASESGTIIVTPDAASADALNQSNGVDSNADPGVISTPAATSSPGATTTPGATSTPSSTATSSSDEDDYEN
jgi:plastocyanin